MKNRVKAIRAKFGLNQTDFGSRIGVTSAAISRWESGERGVPDSAIISICREFGVNELWLRTGAGEMTASQSQQQEMAALVASLTQDKSESFRKQLITTLLRFDPNGPEWEALERIYDSIASQRDPGE